MTKRATKYEDLLKLDLTSVPIENALAHLGRLVDAATDRRDERGLRHAVAVGESLQSRLDKPTHRATVHYYLANAWAGLRHVLRQTDDARWDWEQPEAEHEIVHLRMALQAGRRRDVADRRNLCPILTNLGNLMNVVGRFVEAIGYWDEALGIDPEFGMARGNRGVAFSYYARNYYDRSDAAFLFRGALLELRQALAQPLQSDARSAFEALRERIEKGLNPAFVAEPAQVTEPPKAAQNAEVKYRRWCLKERLFLNPLNDLGQAWAAVRDSLTLPGIVVPLGEGPKYPGFFNQMK